MQQEQQADNFSASVHTPDMPFTSRMLLTFVTLALLKYDVVHTHHSLTPRQCADILRQELQGEGVVAVGGLRQHAHKQPDLGCWGCRWGVVWWGGTVEQCVRRC